VQVEENQTALIFFRFRRAESADAVGRLKVDGELEVNTPSSYSTGVVFGRHDFPQTLHIASPTLQVV